MTILYEVHDIARFEQVQNFASYARLVKCEKSSSGKRSSSSAIRLSPSQIRACGFPALGSS